MWAERHHGDGAHVESHAAAKSRVLTIYFLCMNKKNILIIYIIVQVCVVFITVRNQHRLFCVPSTQAKSKSSVNL